jgi:phosphoesterase RecJ-like protein
MEILSELRDTATGRPAGEVLDSMARLIEDAGTVLVLTHVNPDGDALGSAAALCLGLGRLGKAARALTGQEPPEKFRPFFPVGLVETIPDPDAVAKLARPDLCVLLDTSEPERAGAFRPIVFAPGQKRICLDHHAYHPRERFDAELIAPGAPATGNLVLLLLDRLKVPLDADLARALWIAIATDTGWFRFTNTTPWALQDAARLVRFGVETERIHEEIYESYTPRRARLLGAVLSGIREDLGGELIWSALASGALAAEGGGMADLDGVIEHMKAIRGAEVVALIVEVGPGTHKVSLRSRGAADVERIARRFGGGGHTKAAGYRFQGALPDVVAALRSAVQGAR